MSTASVFFNFFPLGSLIFSRGLQEGFGSALSCHNWVFRIFLTPKSFESPVSYYSRDQKVPFSHFFFCFSFFATDALSVFFFLFIN
jgi:hypothetical protein